MSDTVEYAHFAPHEDGIQHVVDSKSVVVYQGVFDDESRDKNHNYLYLGKIHKGFYMRVADFDNRLTDATLHSDFKKMSEGKTDFFSIWSSSGAQFAAPRSFVVDAPAGMRFDKWAYNQKRNWEKVAESVSKATPPASYDPVKGRFLQLPKNIPLSEFVFSTTQGETHVSLQELEAYVAQLPGPHPRVLSWDHAFNDDSLHRIGSSFLGFYDTWTSSATYATLCKNADALPHERQWPDEAKAVKIDALFKNPGGQHTAEETATALTVQKLRNAANSPNRGASQQAIMDGVSATKVAEMLWAKSPNEKMPKTAEWLHRSAFRYGGLDDSTNPRTSQTKRNLIFGTTECNTHMIRAENAIAKVMGRCPKASTGILITENVLRGVVAHLKENAELDHPDIPKWFKTRWDLKPPQLFWLCFRLGYSFVIDLNPQNINLTFNVRADFDPFSRYRPLILEATLDDIILDAVLNKNGLVDPKKNVKVTTPTVATSMLRSSMAPWSTVPLSAEPSKPETEPVIPNDISLDLFLNRALTVPTTHAALVSAIEPEMAALSISTPLAPASRLTPTTARIIEYTTQLPESYVARQSQRSEIRSVSTQSASNTATSNPAARLFGGFTHDPLSDSIEVDGVILRSPTVILHEGSSLSTAPHAQLATAHFDRSASDHSHPRALPIIVGAAPPPEGFTLEGEIDLFLIPGLTAKFYSWHGPVPPGVESPVDKPVYQKAILHGDLKLSTIIPALGSTPFDALTFRDATFMRQDIPFDPTKAPGWHIDVSFPIDSSCGALHDVLHTVLGMNEPLIHLHAGLGMNQSWGKKLAVHSFTLDGSFPGMTVKICDGLTLTSVGVQLLGFRRVTLGGNKPKTVMDYGFGVFGSLMINVPGTVIPLELDYRMQKIGEILRLAATLKTDMWESPFGIEGLQLTEVAFESDLATSAPMDTFSFTVSALFEYGTTSALFSGSYAAGGQFSLTALMTNFSLFSIYDIYYAITGNSLIYPDVDVKFGSAEITLASGSGLTIALTDVEVEGYVAANALLAIGSGGVTIRGDVTMTGASLTFGELELKKAYIEISLRKNAEDSGVVLGGEMAFSSFTLDALVHLYHGKGKGIQWTAVASLSAAGQALAISKLVPEIKGTFLDLALSDVVFVAASQEDPLVSSLISTQYKIHKGVQVCAILSPIKELDSLMRSSTPTSGLVLSAGWSKGNGFTLDVLMPAESVVYLGNGITTDPFALQIRVGAGKPTLTLIAGVNVPVAPENEVLKFMLSLSINPLEAAATAQMHGNWVNPLGLGKNVVIGPDVALSLEIILAQFFTTGIPKSFGVVGGLAVGKTSAQVAMKISEDPTSQLIKGELKSLDINDLVSFANVITDLDIPQPPKVLDFEDLALYICPFGTVIGTLVYPKGFSFKAAMIIFGKRVEAACAVADNEILINAGIDNFTLGPLTVHGVDSPRATVDVAIGLSRQHILIDGQVTFFDAQAALHAEVGMLPTPTFDFYMMLKFADIFLFQLDAKLEGTLSLRSLENADFVFHALLQQEILRYVKDRIDAQFGIFRSSAEEGVDTAKRALQVAKDEVDRKIEKARAAVQDAERTWMKKRTEVMNGAQKVIDDYLREVDNLEKQIGYAQRDYDKALSQAQADMQKANNDREAAMRQANAALEQAKRDAERGINSAIRELESAKNFLNTHFGYAKRDIENAQREVNKLQAQINAAQRDIDWCNNRPWWDFPAHAAVVGHIARKLTLEAARGVAWTALEVAKRVVQGAGFVAAEGAVTAAQRVLDGARETAKVGISVAQEGVKSADAVSGATVEAARKAVEAARWGGKYIALQGARDALRLYKEGNEAAFREARKAIEALATCVEFLAFRGAEAALDVAKQATAGLDGLQKALDAAKDIALVALTVTQWVVDHLLELVDIRRIELGGSLRSMVGAGGKIKKPFYVHVEYVLMGKAGTFYGEVDLRDTTSFILSLFNQMVGEVKGDPMQTTSRLLGTTTPVFGGSVTGPA